MLGLSVPRRLFTWWPRTLSYHSPGVSRLMSSTVSPSFIMRGFSLQFNVRSFSYILWHTEKSLIPLNIIWFVINVYVHTFRSSLWLLSSLKRMERDVVLACERFVDFVQRIVLSVCRTTCLPWYVTTESFKTRELAAEEMDDIRQWAKTATTFKDRLIEASLAISYLWNVTSPH